MLLNTEDREQLKIGDRVHDFEQKKNLKHYNTCGMFKFNLKRPLYSIVVKMILETENSGFDTNFLGHLFYGFFHYPGEKPSKQNMFYFP